MDLLLSLLVVSTFVVPEVLSQASFPAVVEQVEGDSRIFSTENIRLRCSTPDTRSNWRHLWFKDGEKLRESNELILWRVSIHDSGKYSCQGVRETARGAIYTLQSPPMEIDVDGGFIILHVSPHSVLVGETLNITCRVRDNPKLHEVILYRDGVEVVRQKGSRFHLPNVTLRDRGSYSCRVIWNGLRRSRSAVSVDTPVTILEVLTEPVLEVVSTDRLIRENMMKLVCHLQYNARSPAPPIHYYFYKNGDKLAPASSENHEVFQRSSGYYQCKVRVPVLGLMRWSEAKIFGKVTGIHPALQPRRSPLAPPPTAPTPVLILPTAAPTDPLPTEEIHQPTDAPETVQSNNQTAPSELDMSGGVLSRGDTSGGVTSGGDSSGGDTSGGDSSGGEFSGDHFSVLE